MARRVALFNDSSDGRSPSVIAPRVEEALVNSPPNKVLFEVILLFLRKGVGVKHLSQRIFMVLEPKLVLPLSIVVGRAVIRVRL